MAAKDREVELIIKARETASKQIDIVAKAMDDLAASQEGAGRSATKTGGLLDGLAADIARLQKESAGLSAFGAIAGELAKADTAAVRLKETVRASAEELGALARESQTAASTTNKLRAALEAEIRIRDENKVALSATKKELTAATTLVNKATRDQERYNAALAKVPKPQPAQRSAGTFLQADVDTAQAKQSAISREVAKYDAALKGATASIKELNPQIAAAARHQAALSAAVDKGANNLRQQRSELVSARASLGEIQAVSQRATGALGSLAVSEDKVAAASARMAAELAATRSRIDALSKVPQSKPVSVAADDGQRRIQIEGLRSAKKEYLESQVAVKALVQEIRNSVAPTTEMGAALGRAQAQARLAKQEYTALQGTLRQSTGSFAAFEQRVRALSTISRPVAPLVDSIRTVGSEASRGDGILRRWAQALRDGAAASNDGAAAGGRLRNAFTGIYGESRKSLSLLQRLRGEVLSLAAAYLGLRAAIGQIGGVISAFQTIEASQSRLGVVFKQDTGKVSAEMAFLNEQASRLGISFAILSDEYGKFAVAANAANFSAKDTRKIFVSVAEAARVNKLSAEQMSGVFLALQQMISKGKVSSEELRRQLGDRLAGAFNIFADAIGVTTAELDEMMKKGEVIADKGTLLAFANELDKRFGPQLAAALKSTTAEMGRFQNEVFNAQKRVAEGGFIAGFTEALRELNRYFSSSEGRQFFLGLGQALGSFVQVLARVPQYFRQIQAVIILLIGLKLNATIVGWGVATVKATGAIFAFTGALRTAAGVMAMVKVAATGLFTLLGSIPGLIAGAILIGLSNWATSIDGATAALDEHRRQMDALKSAYLETESAAGNWANRVNSVTLGQAQSALQKLRAELEAFKKENSVSAGRSGGPAGLYRLTGEAKEQAIQLRDLQKAYLANGMAATTFKQKVEAIRLSAASEVIERYALALQDSADKTSDMNDAVEKQAAFVRLLSGTASDADKALLGLADATDKSAGAFGAGSTSIEKYTSAIDVLKGKIPALAEEMKKLKEVSEINAAGWTALIEALKSGNFSQALNALSLWSQAVGANQQADLKGSPSSGYAARISGAESGGDPNAKNTLSSATGLGQFIESTWLNLFKKYFPDRATTMSDPAILALRKNADISMKMIDIYAAENAKVLQTAGVSVNDAALSLAHFLGPMDAIKVLKAAPNTAISDLIGADKISVNKSVLEGKNAGQVVAWAAKRVGLSDEQLSIEKSITAERQKQIDTDTSVEDRIASLKREAEARDESTRAAAIQKEVESALAEAKRTDTVITEEQIARIREAAGAKYDAAHATEELKRKEEEARTLIQELVGLDQQRLLLIKELKLAESQGDTTQLENTRARVEEINARILELLPNAQAMAASLKDEGMVATLQKVALNTDIVAQKMAAASSNVGFLGLNMGQLRQIGNNFASGLVGAFDKFFQGLEEGKSVIDSLKDAFLQFAADFLRQIAQMILQQMILNALNSFMPGMGFGVGHTGGVVGSSGIGKNNQKRNIPPSVFASARRYHGGGVVGLKPGEVPAVLQEGEEVLTADDERHVANGGKRNQKDASPMVNMKIVNAIDAGSFISEGLNSKRGEQSFMNFITNNKTAVKRALG